MSEQLNLQIFKMIHMKSAAFHSERSLWEKVCQKIFSSFLSEHFFWVWHLFIFFNDCIFKVSHWTVVISSTRQKLYRVVDIKTAKKHNNHNTHTHKVCIQVENSVVSTLILFVLMRQVFKAQRFKRFLFISLLQEHDPEERHLPRYPACVCVCVCFIR